MTISALLVGEGFFTRPQLEALTTQFGRIVVVAGGESLRQITSVRNDWETVIQAPEPSWNDIVDIAFQYNVDLVVFGIPFDWSDFVGTIPKDFPFPVWVLGSIGVSVVGVGALNERAKSWLTPVGAALTRQFGVTHKIIYAALDQADPAAYSSIFLLPAQHTYQREIATKATSPLRASDVFAVEITDRGVIVANRTPFEVQTRITWVLFRSATPWTWCACLFGFGKGVRHT